VIASDECYSEIYFKAGAAAGRPGGRPQAGPRLRNLVVLSSLSKRSNVPGMRSGFVAGDAAILKKFLLYRTYHGSAMSPVVQAASPRPGTTRPTCGQPRQVRHQVPQSPAAAGECWTWLPDAGFYLWAKVDKLGHRRHLRPRLYAE
jgi:N-succinyldiaminopimelate aminotransferase